MRYSFHLFFFLPLFFLFIVRKNVQKRRFSVKLCNFAPRLALF